MWLLEVPNGEEFLFKSIEELLAYVDDRKIKRTIIRFVNIFTPFVKQEGKQDSIVNPVPLSRSQVVK